MERQRGYISTWAGGGGAWLSWGDHSVCHDSKLTTMGVMVSGQMEAIRDGMVCRSD